MTLRTAVPLVLLASTAGPLAGQAGAVEPHVEGIDYRAYDRSGRPRSLDEIVAASMDADVLLVGEEHDDMRGHWYEARLFERLADAGDRPVVLSMEMFERDVQYVLDEYLAGLITEEHFLLSARPWDEYDGRYRPLVEAAKARALPVVAANAPRRYVNRVTREGPASLSALSDRALRYLPPLPYPGPSDRYRAQWDAVMAEAAKGMAARADSLDQAHPPAPADSLDQERSYTISHNAIYAQALWDASMGHAIATALMVHRGALVVHFAGSFHVERGTGIPERIADYRPGTRVLTVVIATTDDVGAWDEAELGELGDFVVLTRRPG